MNNTHDSHTQTAFNHTTHTQTDFEQTGFAFENENLYTSIVTSIQNILADIKHSYTTTADNLVDEIWVTGSQKQVNDALNQFVVQNVDMVLELCLELFDDYLRLYCTADVLGMHLSVASNFKLTEARLDRHVQRFAFEQISNTDIITLHSKSWWKTPAIKFAVSAYRTLLRKDPLPFLLSLSPKLKGKPFIEYKGNVIYLEIGRWLPDDIKDYLKKAQVNHCVVKKEQLILKVQPNFSDILSFGDPNSPIITEKDNPNRADDADDKET